MAIQKKAPGQELSDRAVRYHVVGKDHLETTMNETYDPMDFGAQQIHQQMHQVSTNTGKGWRHEHHGRRASRNDR